MSGIRRHLTTLVYVIRQQQVLLMKRRKSPNLGLWSPPGGKIEPGESPLASALRELREETGLRGQQARLVAVVSELDQVRREAWLMFVFRVWVPHGEPTASHREGALHWIPLAQVGQLPVPPADPHILATVLEDRPGVAFLSVRFEDGRLVDVQIDRAGAPPPSTPIHSPDPYPPTAPDSG